MTSDYTERMAKEHARQLEERKEEVKIGEVTGKTTRDINRQSGGTKIRIDHVEDLMFQPMIDLKKGDSVKITIEADWSMRGKVPQLGYVRTRDNAGEASGKVTGDIKQTDNVRIRIDNIEALSFKPSTELQKGDTVRITIAKV